MRSYTLSRYTTEDAKLQTEVPEGAMGSAEGAIAPSAPVSLQAWSPVILKRVSVIFKVAPVIQNGAPVIFNGGASDL